MARSTDSKVQKKTPVNPATVGAMQTKFTIVGVLNLDPSTLEPVKENEAFLPQTDKYPIRPSHRDQRAKLSEKEDKG